MAIFHRRTGAALRRCATLTTLVLVLGCGGGADDLAPTEALLDRLESSQIRHDPHKFVEVDLGEFSISHRKSAENAALFLQFHIYGVMSENDRAEFEQALEARQLRMRDGVIATIQRTDADHLRSANLVWIKTELLQTITKRLRTDTLRDVVFTEYSLEQP